jgi:hypothetical protein
LRLHEKAVKLFNLVIDEVLEDEVLLHLGLMKMADLGLGRSGLMKIW